LPSQLGSLIFTSPDRPEHQKEGRAQCRLKEWIHLGSEPRWRSGDSPTGNLDQMNNVNGAASNATWVGPDATHFHGEWSSAHGQLTQIISALQALHQYAQGKLSQQETASQA